MAAVLTVRRNVVSKSNREPAEGWGRMLGIPPLQELSEKSLLTAIVAVFRCRRFRLCRTPKNM